MSKTCHGSCHCKAVTYEAELDLTQPSYRCNCSICQKLRNWMAFAPAAKVTILSGEDALKDYQFGQKRIHHLFCATCGISPFARSQMPDGTPGFAIKLNTLDDVTPAELAAIPIVYFDGAHDEFKEEPKVKSYL